MPFRVFADSEKHCLKVELCEGQAMNLKMLNFIDVAIPKDITITKVIAPYFYPTNNCPDEGNVYLFDNVHNRWGITKISLDKDIKIEPISWFSL